MEIGKMIGRVALVACVLATAACGPKALKYTVRIESEPPGAKIYDPRTDELIGEAPLEVPVDYVRDGYKSYVRQPTILHQYTAQDPNSKKPYVVSLDTNDSIRVYLAKEGYEKQDQLIDWYFSEIDGQTVKKRVYLKPLAGPGNTASEDVYR